MFLPFSEPTENDILRTESKQESLDRSLLSYMGESASQNDLKEAFCRDIDAYSFEFEPRTQVVGGRGQAGPVTMGPGYRDEKPPKCDVVPQSACAVGYDSSTCSGNINLVLFITNSSSFSIRRWMETYHTNW